MENRKKPQQKVSIQREELVSFLNKTLSVHQTKDVSCNGLQVQGASTITSVALAVDACMEAYEKSVRSGSQILLTHHGIIWNGLTSITGSAYKHLKYLIGNNLNLYAAHLPLDMHPDVGNNAVLSKTLNLQNIIPFGLYKGVEIGFQGTLPKPLTIEEITLALGEYVEKDAVTLPFGPRQIERVAIVSGGASDELSEAITKGADLYITGEPSHKNYHEAREAQINVLYCGHYHSEKPGIQALGNLVREQWGIETVFIDIPTTV